MFDLTNAQLDVTSQTYDVTHSTQGMFYDIFNVSKQVTARPVTGPGSKL